MPIENEQDKALHAQADQHKRDLKAGADVQVPTGDEANPPGRVDPFAARKAMFQQADAIRDEQAAKGGTVQDARLEALAKEAGIDIEALRRGHTGTPAEHTATTTPTEPSNSRTLHLNKEKTNEPASTQASQTGDAYVTVTVNGAEIKVAQRDVDRAGGVEQYRARREQQVREDAMARENAELRRQIDEMRRRQQELQQGAGHPAGQGDDPANRAADPAAQHRNDAGNTGVDDERLIERLADQIYSGDRDDAAKGIRDLLRIARSKGEVPNVDEIVAKVKAELVDSTPTAEGTKSTASQPRKIDPMVERINREINAMAQAEFPDLMQLPAARAATYERFLELVKQPENANRLAIDVARDALEEMEPKFVNRRQTVIERKRGLQTDSAASAATSGPAEAAVPDASSIVEQMAKARRFGRPIPTT